MNNAREKNIDTILTIIKYLLICFVVVGLLYLTAKVFPYLMPFFMGLLLAEAAMFISGHIKNVPKYLTRRREKPRKRHDGDKLAVTIYFIIVASIIVLIIFSITAGFSQLRSFLESLPRTLSRINLNNVFSEHVEKISDPELQATVETTLNQINKQVSSKIPMLVSKTLNVITGMANAMPLFLLVIVVSLMCGYYSINGSRRIYVKALKMTGNRALVRNLFTLISQVINTVFRIVGGYVLLMLITFVESWIGFLIIRVPNAWIWAFICAVIDILPVLGIAAVMIPMIIYFAATGATFLAVGVVILLIVMTIARRMWEPLILGSVMKLHPLMTIFSMIAGIVFWGLSGVVLGPLYLVTLQQFLTVFDMKEQIRSFISNRSTLFSSIFNEKKEESEDSSELEAEQRP